jgi:predicted DNA-binding protein
MSGNYHRAQILLEPDQHRKLKQLAERQGRSISDVAREIVSSGLQAMADEEEARSARWVDVQRRLRVIRDAARSRRGVYQGDLVGEIRAERSRDQDAARGKGS